MRDLTISKRRIIPRRMLRVRFARSGGPGGQKVNKLASKVDLRLDLDKAVTILGEDMIRRIRHKLANRLDGSGNLQVTCGRHREQARNLEDALQGMTSLIRIAIQKPRTRKPTRPGRTSREQRLAAKRRRSELKQLRRTIDPV